MIVIECAYLQHDTLYRGHPLQHQLRHLKVFSRYTEPHTVLYLPYHPEFYCLVGQVLTVTSFSMRSTIIIWAWPKYSNGNGLF